MPLYQIYFNDPLNCSIQIGDFAWFSIVDSLGIASTYQKLGTITDIDGNIITVNDPAGTTVAAGNYFSFTKPIETNESGLKGYYAEVVFENQSSEYVELFAISSEAVISSK